MSRVGLIQLVSEQTMQNVLPILALKPARITHLVTPKTAVRSAWITESARQAGVPAPAEDVLLSPMPGIAETAQATHRCILELRNQDLIPVVNFTGGTKLMSVGAFACASKDKATSLYVDTEFRHFTNGGTGTPLDSLLNNDLSFTPYQRSLTVNTIAVANGCARVTNGKDWSRFLPLVDHLFRDVAVEKAVFDVVHGERGLCAGGNEPRTPRAWLSLCDRDIDLPASAGDLAAKAGLLAKHARGYRLVCPFRKDLERMACARHFRPDRAYFSAKDLLQFSLSFLAGAWWEVVMADRAQKSGRFRDVRWSAFAGRQTVSGSMEEDLLAVDGVRIAYFSCKRGGARGKLMRQLEEMNASAERLGGRFVSKFFCVYLPPLGAYGRELTVRARSLGIRLVTRNDLSDSAWLK